MQKNFFLLVIIFLLSACIHQQAVRFFPIKGIALSYPYHKTLGVALSENKFTLYKDKQHVAIIEKLAVTKNYSAVEWLRIGIKEANKGKNKPSTLDLPDDYFGYVVKVDDFSTIFLASSKEPDYWLLISVENQYFDYVIKHLELPPANLN